MCANSASVKTYKWAVLGWDNFSGVESPLIVHRQFSNAASRSRPCPGRSVAWATWRSDAGTRFDRGADGGIGGYMADEGIGGYMADEGIGGYMAPGRGGMRQVKRAG